MLAFHPYADLFPLMEGDQFAELVADIKANDLREKIVVWDGAILDGRNRYRAALAAGLLENDDEPDRVKYFSRFVPAVDGDPLSFVISKNLQRRHLSDIQRASVAGKIVNLRPGHPGKNPPIGGISTEQAAATLNVAARQVERARLVHEQGVSELRGALDRGEIAISAAERIARLPQAEQRQQLPNGARAIMGSRQEPDDSLDYFPTPPWATRALVEIVLPQLGAKAPLGAIWEPACGEGHMAEALGDYGSVIATDIGEYGYGQPRIDFLTQPCPYPKFLPPPDWIITNPPFGATAEKFVLTAIERARVGVAMFFRLQWLETNGRYERIFQPFPPALIAQFAERVPLHKGRWEPNGDTATAYLWIVWLKDQEEVTRFFWIPPGQREALSKPDDAERFTTHPVTRRAPLPPHDPSTGEIIEYESDPKHSGEVGEEPAATVTPCAAAAGSEALANG